MTKKILIADDEPTNIKVVEMCLKGKGYVFISAHDGLEALAKIREELPDLIILDVMMPKMDGYKVCGLVKADQRYKSIPIIMITARAQEADKQISEDVGADAYINKPFNAKELTSKIDTLLGD